MTSRFNERNHVVLARPERRRASDEPVAPFLAFRPDELRSARETRRPRRRRRRTDCCVANTAVTHLHAYLDERCIAYISGTVRNRP
jgi:hypothetical protein